MASTLVGYTSSMSAKPVNLEEYCTKKQILILTYAHTCGFSGMSTCGSLDFTRVFCKTVLFSIVIDKRILLGPLSLGPNYVANWLYIYCGYTQYM